MNRFIPFIFFLLLLSSLQSQTTFYCENCNVSLSDGVTLYVEGDIVKTGNDNNLSPAALTESTIIVTGDIVQQGTASFFKGGDRSIVRLKNGGTHAISSSAIGQINFHKLQIEDGGTIISNTDYSVNTEVNFNSGNLNLNGRTISLVLDPYPISGFETRLYGDAKSPYPLILNENINNRIFESGFSSGQVIVSENLASGFNSDASPINFGNMGATIGKNGMTNITVSRRHEIQTVNSLSSLKRFYDILSSDGFTPGGNLKFDYLHGGPYDDLSSITNEDDLVFFKHGLTSLGNIDASNWLNEKLSNLNVANDFAYRDDLPELYNKRFTLVECVAPAVSASGSIDSLCFGETAILDAGTGTGWTYLWSTGETTQTINVVNNTMSSTPITDTYYVIVTDTKGCFSRDSVKVVSLDFPTVNFNNALETVCDGETLTLSPVVTGNSLAYLWSTGATTPTIDHLSDGTQNLNYAITVTSYNRCAETAFVQVEDKLNPVIDLPSDTTDCEGVPIVLDVGSTAGNAYLWSTGGTTNSITVTTTDFYSITVTNSDLCSSTAQSLVGISDINLSYTKDNIFCNGSPEGNIYLNITGISGDFLVDWSNGAGTVDLLGVEAGTYSVTVSDMTGCSDSLTNILITEPAPITSSPIIVHDYCGLGTGSVISNPSGGTPMLDVTWYQNGMVYATTQDISNVPFGTYNLSILDINGCMYDTTIVVEGMNITPDYGVNVFHETCPDSEDGSIEIINPDGGYAPYSFAWSNGASTQSVSGLAPGDYTVTITDDKGCSYVVNTWTIIEKPTVNIVLESQIDNSCFGDAAGELTISIDGIQGGQQAQYFIEWSNGEVFTESISGLASGEYSVTVTFDDNCTVSETYIVSEPDILSVSSATADDLCGDNGGQITSIVNGGVGPYQYLWSNGATTPDIANLGVGEYTLSVTDVNSCTATETFSISDVPPLNVTVIKQDLQCTDDNSGMIELLVSGGSEPYKFTWAHQEFVSKITNLSPGSYVGEVLDANLCREVVSVTINNVSPIQVQGLVTDLSGKGTMDGGIDISTSGGKAPYTFLWSNGESSEDISGLAAGVYNLTVIDDNNCEFQASFVVNEPDGIEILGSSTDISCNGVNDGSILLEVIGGEKPYQFSWSDGNSTQNRENLSAGIYSITVNDANGLQSFSSFEISEPSAIAINLVTNDIACSGEGSGEITANISGGTEPYNIEWSTGMTTEIISNLIPGTYTITVTDANLCSQTEETVINEPDALVVSAAVTAVSSAGAGDGKIDLSVSGGTAPYSFSWNTGQIGEDLNNLSEGSYTVTISDANGCTIAEVYEVRDPSSIVINGVVSSNLCFGASEGGIILEVTGGEQPLTFSWSSGVSTKDINNLEAGTYAVTVTDNTGLKNSASFEVLQGTEIIVNSAIVKDVQCGDEADGSIELDASGGEGDLSFAWSDGSTGPLIENLTAGTYEVSISDANNCMQVFSYDISATDEIVIQGEATNSSCNGNFDGSVSITVSGGNAPYTFAWSNGQISEDIVNLAPGLYTVTVTDVNGCSSTFSEEISGGSDLSITSTVNNVSCFGANDGSIDISVSGALGELTYMWSNGESTEDVEDLDNGTYNLQVADMNGCTAESTFVISEPEPFVLNIEASLVGCSGTNDGSLKPVISGGEGPYDYAWSNGSNEEVISGLSAGNYSLTVTDVNGCIAEINTNVQSTDKMLEVRYLVASPVKETETLQFLDLTYPKPSAWLWKFGDPKFQTSTQEDPLFRYDNNPNEDESIYTSKLIASNAFCVDSLSKDIRIINTRSSGPQVVSDPEQIYTEITNVSVYPNPVSDLLNTEVELNQADKVEIRVVNMSGQIMRHYIMDDSQVYFKQINMRDMTQGFYFVYITSGSDSRVQKIVVSR